MEQRVCVWKDNHHLRVPVAYRLSPNDYRQRQQFEAAFAESPARLDYRIRSPVYH
jgi:hypothetical protein